MRTEERHPQTFGKFSKLVNEHSPVDEGKDKGFLEFSAPDNAIGRGHGHEQPGARQNPPLRGHSTTKITEKYENIGEALGGAPASKEYVDQGNLRRWPHGARLL